MVALVASAIGCLVANSILQSDVMDHPARWDRDMGKVTREEPILQYSVTGRGSGPMDT